MNTPHPDLVLTDEVAQALNDRTPVVALESTIISHGMPFPQNVEMATEVERIIRGGGAVPATIAVLKGRPRIGLTHEDLHLLATSPDAFPKGASAPGSADKPCQGSGLLPDITWLR